MLNKHDLQPAIVYFTGYKLVFEDDEFGLIYDTPTANFLSLHRSQQSMTVDNTFQYPTESQLANWGFYIQYEVRSNVVEPPETAPHLFGIIPLKKSAMPTFNIEERIVPDAPEKPIQQGGQNKPQATPSSNQQGQQRPQGQGGPIRPPQPRQAQPQARPQGQTQNQGQTQGYNQGQGQAYRQGQQQGQAQRYPQNNQTNG
ncbi:hypothetical protein [Azobacteroides phage ProJPt-Bp1]|uniref:Uncharacterized protein n=1 Tax=Azobacteroides phage ProJPt-Bp1 TaxID=1920526 RepID=A0A1V1FSB0_9CAUD|nr:hypothetical protein KNT10_gp08 [Azobacteroides phage ProJPt-Bp1]BAX03455.1 hypothetical protein [Azobacteroides phage ProJPt-Bp1]